MKTRRYITEEIQLALKKKMVFLSGPRQVGKTTLAKSYLTKADSYLNYDFPGDRKILLKNELPQNQGLIVLDEIHKMKGWRNVVKGYYDKFHPELNFLVTGSARLDLYRKGGDSLQGRYRHFRLHPLSVKELKLSDTEGFKKLMCLGGFPEPYFSGSEKEARIWRNDYFSRIVREEISSLENVQDLSLLEQLIVRLPDLVGSPLSINSLREDLNVSHLSVRRWLEMFERNYAIFRISPFGSAKIKAVKKESKHYHYDWALVGDEGARFENLIASHLLKWIHYHQDVEGRNIELRFFRDQDQREVDFVLQEKGKPLIFIECKLKSREVSPSLIYLKKKFPQVRAIQVDSEKNSLQISSHGIEKVSALDFLNELI